jgi:hypothetical protein
LLTLLALHRGWARWRIAGRLAFALPGLRVFFRGGYCSLFGFLLEGVFWGRLGPRFLSLVVDSVENGVDVVCVFVEDEKLV